MTHLQAAALGGEGALPVQQRVQDIAAAHDAHMQLAAQQLAGGAAARPARRPGRQRARWQPPQRAQPVVQQMTLSMTDDKIVNE